MVDLLKREFGGQVYTLPATKWNWRMRISALHFSEIIPTDETYEYVRIRIYLPLHNLFLPQGKLNKSLLQFYPTYPKGKKLILSKSFTSEYFHYLNFFALTVCFSYMYSVLFASSVVNLCELIALRPDLSKLHKLYYFHENQLIYPVRKQQDRDFQHGYSQILSW